MDADPLAVPPGEGERGGRAFGWTMVGIEILITGGTGLLEPLVAGGDVGGEVGIGIFGIGTLGVGMLGAAGSLGIGKPGIGMAGGIGLGLGASGSAGTGAKPHIGVADMIGLGLSATGSAGAGGKPEIGVAGTIDWVGARSGGTLDIGMAGLVGPPEIRSSGTGIAVTADDSSNGAAGGAWPEGLVGPVRGPNENDCWQFGQRNSEPGAGSRSTSCIPAQ